jgi:hypothetical protein
VTRLLEAAGVDSLQWRVLVRTFLKIDFGALRTRADQKGTQRAAAALFFTALIYFVSGVAPAAVIVSSRDVLLGATTMTTIVGFMVLSSLLVGEGLSILSPDDHAILGYRPVTSRTYLAVRVATLFVRTIVITSLISVLPVIALLLKNGGGALAAAGGIAAAQGAGAAVTLGLVALYGWLLRMAGPARLLRFMSYAQFAINMIVWLGFIAVTQGLQRQLLGGFRLDDSPWSLVYPGAWFASFVRIGAGDFSVLAIAGAALAVVLLAVLVASIGGKLSLDYTEALGRLTTVTAARPAAARSAAWLALVRNETRAVAILVRGQFRNDLRFRLGLLSLLPITFVYLLIGARDGAPTDPFVSGGSSGSEVGLIQIALMFLPMTLRQLLVTSEAYRASWLFYATPVDRTRLVLGARDIITLFFLVPYVCFLAGLFTYFFGSVLHAVVHAFFLGFMSYLVLQLTIMLDPKLPFATPPQKDTRGAMMFGVQMAVFFLGMIAYFVLTHIVYRSATRLIVTLGIFLAAAWTMARITRRRVERQAEGFSYLE